METPLWIPIVLVVSLCALVAMMTWVMGRYKIAVRRWRAVQRLMTVFGGILTLASLLAAMGATFVYVFFASEAGWLTAIQAAAFWLIVLDCVWLLAVALQYAATRIPQRRARGYDSEANTMTPVALGTFMRTIPSKAAFKVNRRGVASDIPPRLIPGFRKRHSL